MENTGEQPSFELKSAIEQTPFESPAVQSFFGEWCEINDGIRPEFVDRNIWNDRGGIDKILEQKPGGKKALYIPRDLQLWEMVGVMEAVDKDTFSENPERQSAKKEELKSLGHMFENSAIYIAQRIESIDQGKPIAENLAKQFYDYGQSIVTGKKPDREATLEELGQLSIPDNELENVDKWLAGDRLYAAQRKKLDKVLIFNPSEKDKLLEEARRDTLNRFFRISEKAFERQIKTVNGELSQIATTSLKPWESATPVHAGFINKVEGQVQRQIETPKRELVGSIFRRGMEFLQRNMPFDKLPEEVKEAYLWWKNGEKTLREALGIDVIKENLKKVRDKGDITKIAEAEEGISSLMQEVISNYKYKLSAHNPSEMITNQEINCVGASMLGGAFLSELGINYLVGDLPEHSVLFLITSAGDVKFMDMLAPVLNHKLEDNPIKGSNKDNRRLSVSDIVNFSKNPASKGLRFGLDGEEYAKLPNDIREMLRSITVYEPGYGQKLQVLFNTGGALRGMGKFEEAVEVYRRAIDLDSGHSASYNNLGSTLVLLNREDEAIEQYRNAIALDPQTNKYYVNLADVFSLTNQHENAAETYQKAIELGNNSPKVYTKLALELQDLNREEEADKYFRKSISLDDKFAITYFTYATFLSSSGRKEEAVEKFKKFLELSDPEMNKELIDATNTEIIRLQESNLAKVT